VSIVLTLFNIKFMAQKLKLYSVLLIMLCSCSNVKKEYLELTYGSDMEEFTNPERGFYRPFGTKMSAFKPLDVETLLSLKNPNPAAGGFKVGSSLVYRSYQFDDFKEGPLNQEVLGHIQNDMEIVREAGMKVILRFTYSNSCCEPPFNDAPKATILKHLEQLKPLLTKNEDVIAVIQMGLIGPWGEQFYSDHFGDLEHGPVTNQHWEDRNEVISALLDVVPQSRMVQVRAPYYKLRFLDGENAHPEKADALDEKEAFSGSARARLAHHNDCISEGGNAENYLKRFHTSFLNTSWSGAVNRDWNNKCIEDIKRNLGYRFVLKKGIFPIAIKNSEPTKIYLEIENIGYSSTYNYRFAELILRNKDSNEVYRKLIDCDTRYWFSDEVQVLDLEFEWPVRTSPGQFGMLSRAGIFYCQT